ncbi:MAG: hypothetical protein JW996_05720, partial [Candidatus Cloacimonetes bacterium]|nr:hypothetical protein [Candidatus Cloacimonadota bacterium]
MKSKIILVSIIILRFLLLDGSTDNYLVPDEALQLPFPDKAILSENQQKLASELLLLTESSNLADDFRFDNIIQSLSAQNTLRQTRSGLSVYVYIYFRQHQKHTQAENFCEEITDHGPDFVVAWVKVDQLLSLASLPEVRTIRVVTPPEFYTGSVTTEGDIVHQTAYVRNNYNSKGRGIKIGVITDGVDSRVSAQASGDLPYDGYGLTVLSNIHGGDEGTALLEIIHDMTPQAELFFHDSGFNTVDFTDAISALISSGCNIICDDVGWITEPFFEDGYVAQYISEILSSREDLIFVTSAGNAGESHYQGFFYPNPSAPSQHDFSQGQGGPFYIYLDMPEGSSIRVVLQWFDAFGGSGNDYDLYLVHTGTGTTVTGSVYVQDGDDDPLEFMMYMADATYNGEFVVIVNKYYGDPCLLELFLYPVGVTINQQYMSPTDAIFGHAAASGVISVAATHYTTPYVPETFSSQGPSTKYDWSSRPFSEALNSLDVSSCDGVRITGAGGFGYNYPPGSDNWWFYGTSASSPHTA